MTTGSAVKPNDLDQITAAAPKNAEITSVRGCRFNFAFFLAKLRGFLLVSHLVHI
jgi:hypothetical protein